MRDGQDDLVFRPDFRTGLIVLAALVVATVSIVAAILVGDAPTVIAPIAGGLFAAPIILSIGALFSSRITVTAQELVVRGLFTRRRRSRSHIAQVVRATITAPRGTSSESLFVLDAQRNLLVRVSSTPYTREDLDRLVDALGVPCSGPGDPVKAKEFDETYPGLVSLAERHPYRIVFATVGIVCAAALAALALVSIPSGPNEDGL